MEKSVKKIKSTEKVAKEVNIEEDVELEVQNTFNESSVEELIDEEGSVENVSY